MTLLERLTRWLDEGPGGPLPAASQWHAKAHLLDSVGMILAARDHPLTARAAAISLPGAEAGTVAFAAGVACDVLGLDDFDEITRTHPGAVVVSALIGAASASESTVSGEDLLNGVVAGYEIICRFGELAQAWSLHDKGWHPTGVCGAVGAAAGAAVARGVDATAAVGLAASLASGVFELDDLGAVKGMQTGWAAQSAVTALGMAGVGYRPTPTVLDGRRGLLHALGCARPTEDEVAAALGQPPRIERVSFKPFSHFTDLHPATAALLDLLRGEGITVNGIAEVEVHLAAGIGGRLNKEFPPASPRLARRCPRFALAALACRADTAALADPLIEAFDGSSLYAEDILELGHRVQWSDDLPTGPTKPSAIVTVRGHDGAARTASATGYPGDGRRPEHRWSWGEVAARYRLVAPEDTLDLIGTIAELETLSDVRPLAKRIGSALQRHPPATTTSIPPEEKTVLEETRQYPYLRNGR